MLRVSFEQFQQAATQGNLVPVYWELLADLETPVSVFRKLTDAKSYAFLLESVEGGEKVGRYSFLGVDPAVILRVRGREQELISNDPTLAPGATPIATLRALLARYKPVIHPDLPPFFGGAVGYLAYDTVRYFESIPDTCPDDLQLPDALIMVAESAVAFDHVRHRMILMVNVRTDDGRDLRAAYDEAVAQLRDLRERVLRPLPDKNNSSPEVARFPKIQIDEHPVPAELLAPISLPVASSMSREEYLGAVAKSKEYIAAGDVFQVVLSQRFTAQISCDPFDVYRALRAVNPSPYMFYLKCGSEFSLAGSSPEILCKLSEGRVQVRPIAGTRPRGRTPAEDKKLEQELLADQKEIAEHIMLVDLGRNDVGRVSVFGTVKVDDFKTIERYSHVMHIVSHVSGDLNPDRDAIDALGATFPAGTLTGAPKIRAMEVIDELEKTRRGPYGGTVVYMGFNGAMDSCITIRTAIIRNGRVYVQAGAGIVADSVPMNEYLECINKAKGMLKAVAMADEGLD